MKNRLKKIKGQVPYIGEDEAYDGDGSMLSPFLAALANPDLLSDENPMFAERDFDAEEERAAYLEKFKEALTRLTARQRSVLAALARYKDHQKAADKLGVARVTVTITLGQIQKKISKVINKIEKRQCDVRNTNEE